MSALDTILLALDYIEAHLQSPIAVADMAAAVGYSVYHFCRTFNQVTHHTPYDYLVRRRMAEAAGILLETDRRAIDVALDYGYNSPETFSRAFRRVYGLSPRQARRAGRIDSWRRMPRLTRAHLEHLHKGSTLKPVLEERDAVRVIGAMSLQHRDRASSATMWDWLERELKPGEGQRCGGDRYGIAYYPPDWETRGYSYMAAVELEGDAAVGSKMGALFPGLVTQVLRAGEWARFVHRGATVELDLTLDYILHTWLPQSGCDMAQPLVVEQFYAGVQDAERGDGERAILIPITPRE
jgi:AraC family transcriptional regulator